MKSTPRFFLIFLYLALVFMGNRANAQNTNLNNITQNIQKEIVELKVKYRNTNDLIYNDIYDILLSIKTDESLTDSSKILYLEALKQYLAFMRQDIYAQKKFESHSYRRAIRFIPTIVYYREHGELLSVATSFSSDMVNAIRLMPDTALQKAVLLKIGNENARIIYNALDEIHAFPFAKEVVETLAIADPSAFVYSYDAIPALKNLTENSPNPVLKKILDIKRNYGNQSTLYFYLNEIIRNGFNDTKEVDFATYKMNYTKILLKIAQDSTALGRNGAIQYLGRKGKWVFEDFVEYGNSIFADFSADELFLLSVMCVEVLQREDLENIFSYLEAHNEVSLDIVRKIPLGKLERFYDIVQKHKLEDRLNSILDAGSLGYILEQETYKSAFRPTLKNTHWLTTPFDPAKEEQARVDKQKKEIAYRFNLNKVQYSLLSWTRNLNKVDSNFVSIVNSAIGENFLNYIAVYHSEIILRNFQKLKDYKNLNKLLIAIAENAPNKLKAYLGTENDINTTLKTIQNPSVQLLLDIYKKYKFATKAYTLIDPILSKKMSLEKADELGHSEIPYLRELCRISSSQNPKGLQSVETEQNELSLKLIREINDNPSTQNKTLIELKQMNSNELYSFLIWGREELFDFTFNQFYATLNEKLGADFNVLAFFEEVHSYRFREFCNLLAEFDKLSTFLKYHSTEAECSLLIEKMVDIDFSDVKALDNAAILSELIARCDDPEIQQMIQRQIVKSYQVADGRKDQLALAVYSLLAGNIGHRAVENNKWFTSMESKYAKHTHTSLKINELKNAKNRIIETCYFYDDPDGRSSYSSFINTFKSLNNWLVQDLGSYVYISTLSGQDIEIYANKPQNQIQGQSLMKTYLMSNNLEPSIVVHRGHSYHSQKTIEQMIGEPKFIFMGSCGGFYKIPELMERSPNAHILSTKQVGTMAINDPTLRKINELLRENQNLDWVQFWEEEKMILGRNKDFKDYVPPHKNNAALFINAFFNVVSISSAQ